MEKKQIEKCVLYLGSYGFPYGMAEVQKIFLVSKSLACEGITVYVVNSRGVHSRGKYPQLKKCGRFEGIVYLYSSLTQYRDEEFIKRNIKKTFERILEFIAITKIYRRKNVIV